MTASGFNYLPEPFSFSDYKGLTVVNDLINKGFFKGGGFVVFVLWSNPCLHRSMLVSASTLWIGLFEYLMLSL
jgi:hypothetical protein